MHANATNLSITIHRQPAQPLGPWPCNSCKLDIAGTKMLACKPHAQNRHVARRLHSNTTPASQSVPLCTKHNGSPSMNTKN